MTHLMTKLLPAGVAGLAVAGAALRISPMYHNFGDVAVMGLKTKAFQVTLPPGSARGITLEFSIIGPDAADFHIGPDAAGEMVRSTVDPFDPNSPCPAGAQGVVCTKQVEFRPRSLGPKKATLVVKDGRGSSNSAALEGMGVAPLCTHTVVPCNYALHFSGVFSWTSTLSSPGSQYRQHVNVDVAQGVAACNGSATSSEQGRSLTGAIVGTGLIGVEFLNDPVYPWVYLITVACPSPDWPATEDAAAIPSRPAELGQNEFTSEKQPVGRPGMRLEQAIASVTKLEGSINYPTPGVDESNGVTGQTTVNWYLCPNSRYQSPNRQAGSLRQGRCQ